MRLHSETHPRCADDHVPARTRLQRASTRGCLHSCSRITALATRLEILQYSGTILKRKEMLAYI